MGVGRDSKTQIDTVGFSLLHDYGTFWRTCLLVQSSLPIFTCYMQKTKKCNLLPGERDGENDNVKPCLILPSFIKTKRDEIQFVYGKGLT